MMNIQIYSKFTIVKKYIGSLLFASLFLLLISGCSYKSRTTEVFESASEKSSSSEALTDFHSNISGDTVAQNSNKKVSTNESINIGDISDSTFSYAFFDMNGDDIPELHVRPVINGAYYIFTCQDSQVYLWYAGTAYETPLNNAAILYTRQGGAPAHKNYKYICLDFNGNVKEEVYFSQYDAVDSGDPKVEAKYIINDQEVSEESWKSLTGQYLSEKSDQIIWQEKQENSHVLHTSVYGLNCVETFKRA